jgi:hypothetical protein
MKRLSILLLVWLLIANAVLADDPQKKVSCNLRNASYAEFASFIFNETGVRIFYQKETVKNIQVTLKEDSLSVLALVEKTISGTNLRVSEWNKHLVVLPEINLYTGLPPFQPILSESQDVSDAVEKKTTAEEKYLTGRAPEVVKTIRIGNAGAIKTTGKAKILGRILDKDSGEPIYNATLYFPDLETGVVTDENGFATLLLRPGKHAVRIDYLGYERKNYLFDVYNDGNFTIELGRTVIQMKEFVVYGDKQMSMKSKDPGLDKIAMKTIKELPMMMGERDVLKISSMLPGIVNTGEGTSGINVRGGGSDQNAFYINKIPVYNTSHLFGFFPAFNSEIIRDFSVYKGHIPAQFGGRLSSVFNITTRQGNRKRFSVHGGISPITGNIVVEGPIIKDTCSVLLSARTSYSDWMLERIEDPTIRASSANFNDFAAAVNFDVQKTQIAAFAYRSYDRFRLADINDYNYTNSGVSLSISRTVNAMLRGELSLIAADYSFKTTDRQQISSAYEHAYQTSHYEARLDFKHVISSTHTLDYGLGSTLYKLDRGTVSPLGILSLRIPVELGQEKGLESSIYISDTYEPNPRLSLTLGLRFSVFNPLGPDEVLVYAPGLPKDLRFIEDTLSFSNNQPLKWYTEPDIRAAVNYSTDENGSLKFAFNQMHQHLFLLNNTVSISPSAQWKLADYHLKPSQSNQVSMGVFRNLKQWGLETSFEVYYKQAKNFPEFRDGADFLKSPHVETAVLQGTQKSYGFEFFLKRNNRKIDGWLSYTYSRSLIQVDDVNKLNTINNGLVYPSNHDIPHVVNLVVNYHIRRRLTLSSVVTYQSGRPVTFPTSFYYVNGVPMLDYSNRNAYRIPDYFRTDLSLTLEGSLKKEKFIHSSLVISVYNLTGRENPYSVYFKNEEGKIKSYQYSVIGVPILTATWIFKLGNYAAE